MEAEAWAEQDSRQPISSGNLQGKVQVSLNVWGSGGLSVARPKEEGTEQIRAPDMS